MLTYSWNYPHEKNVISVFEEDEKDLLNLFSKILLIKIKALIKKGFYKEYVERKDVTSIIRGKILFKESIQSFSHKRGKLHIQDEELSYDILHNQILKATLSYLAKHEAVDKKIRDEIIQVLGYFSRISLIRMDLKLFQQIRLHRNNRHYQFLLHICQFVWEDVLIHEGESQKNFQDVSRDHGRMAKLFENFVKNFYRIEIPNSISKSETFYWPAEGENAELLPIMETDISLQYGEKKFIMDTKFYKDMFSYNWSKESVRSDHLYQLFSYLKNDEFYQGKKAQGVLIYPKVYKSVDLAYQINGFDITICTLDMNQDWRGIHNRLLEIAGVNL